MPAHAEVRPLTGDAPRGLAQAQRARAVAELEAVAGHVEQRDQRAVGAARSRCHRLDLAREALALGEAVRSTDREVTKS